MNDVLIVQSYNVNRGDRSVVSTILRVLWRRKSVKRIAVTAYEPQKAFYDYEQECVRWFFDIEYIKQSGNLLQLLWRMCFEFSVTLAIVLATMAINEKKVYRVLVALGVEKKETYKQYMDSRVVVLPGGHFFTSLNKFPVVYSHYISIVLAFALKKKTMIFAQTIGPFEGIAGWVELILTKHILANVDCVTLRDQLSVSEYSRYCKNSCILVGETVFADIEVDNCYGLCEKKSEYVAITLHHIYYRQFFSEHIYLNAMANICRIILGVMDLPIHLIVMESESINRETDETLCRKLHAICMNDTRIQIVNAHKNLMDLHNEIRNATMFVGTKTHSIVYALKYCVPTLAIAYQDKSRYFMEIFGCDEYSIDMKDLLVCDISELLSNLKKNSLVVREKMRTNAQIVQKCSLKSFELLEDLVLLGQSK